MVSNAKINNIEISKKIGLSSPATMQRVRRLQDSGIICGYKTVLDKKKLGKNLSCFMAITLKGETVDSALNMVEKRLKKLEEIEEIHLLTGRYDLLIKVHVKDVDDLREFMINKLKKIEAFRHVETFITLSSIDNPNFSAIK